ncbi:MAG: hypothetical protein AAF551_05140 [Bacteroidota bacterium]
MKIYPFLNPLLVFVLCVSLFSCLDEDVIPDDTGEGNANCPEPGFDLTANQGFDILLSAPLKEGLTYAWEITTMGTEGDTLSVDTNSDNAFTWGPGAGTVVFCLTVKAAGCEEGTTLCKTFVATEAQFEAGNQSNALIEVIETGDNTYTYKITDEGSNASCPGLNFAIKSLEGFDILLDAPLKEGFVYDWTITTTGVDGETRVDSQSDNVFSWGPGAGTVEFCLNVLTSDCEESETFCKKFVATEAQFEEGNQSNKSIEVIKTDDDVYTYEITDKDSNKACPEIDFDLKSREGFDILLDAPLNVDYIYNWTITTTGAGGETSEDTQSDNIFSWGPGVGTVEFCLFASTDACKEGGPIVCKTFVATEAQFEEGNQSDKVIEVIETEENVFTYKITDAN